MFNQELISFRLQQTCEHILKWNNNGLFQKLDAHPPPKEDMGILKILTTFFIGKSKKIEHFFGCKGQEDMGIPKISNHF